jgi:mRNA interferase HigB
VKAKIKKDVFNLKTFLNFVFVNIIAKGSLLYYIERYPKARTALLTWYHEFSKNVFQNFNELKSVYGNSSIVANHRVIFNIKGNEFRLITSINFRTHASYIIWFGSHIEYDKVDVETINFDTNIINFKK